MENATEMYEPFYTSPSRRRKTSAEIVSEARRSLSTVSTQRPFTPKEDQRRLFSQHSSHTAENRPASTFSLHARHFEEPRSRPGSGKRLSPLEHRPRVPKHPGDEDEDSHLDGPAESPKPPAVTLQARRGSAARARLLMGSSQGELPLKMQQDQDKRSSGLLLEVEHSLVQGVSANVHQARAAQVLTSETRSLFMSNCEKMGLSRPTTERASPGHYQPTRTSPGSPLQAGLSSEVKGEGERDGEAVVESGEHVYWNNTVQPLLQELESTAQAGAVERLCSTCEQLHKALAEGDLLGRKCSRRSTLLRTLFRLVDMGSDRLSLQLAHLALALNVSGNNLLNICKLIYKISRNDSNDVLFQNSAVMDSLLSLVSPDDLWVAGEALLYCVATLKFLSGDATLLQRLQAKGAVPALLQLACSLNRAQQPGLKQDRERPPVSSHILLQLTATLRNLADLPESRSEFLLGSGLVDLCDVLRTHASDKDVCTNVARIFSKLSSYHDGCVALANVTACYPAFSQLLTNYQKQQDLLVRVLFIQGNLTARSDSARERLCEEGGGLGALLALFQTYATADVASSEGILAKLTRVLANTAILPAAGAALAADGQCVPLLLDVLESALTAGHEELVINTTAAINNLSFYESEDSVLRASPLSAARLMLKQLLSTNMNAVLEAVRVLGNLSQSRDVRDFMLGHKAHLVVVTLLDSRHQDLCYAACGVLTNLTVDQNCRAALRDEGAVLKLLDCLRDWGPADWQLASVACQALWNLSEDGAALCFGDCHTQSLLELLCHYLNKDLVTQFTERENRQEVWDFHWECWEMEFLPVAQRLMDRIQTEVSIWEPLTVSS